MTIPGHGITQPSITNGKIFSISHITLLQLDGIIWEEDSIAYGCENATLVLNNQKGLLRKNYACLESGRYQTPDGKDTPWPVCTTNPTDPCESGYVCCVRFVISGLLPSLKGWSVLFVHRRREGSTN